VARYQEALAAASPLSAEEGRHPAARTTCWLGKGMGRGIPCIAGMGDEDGRGKKMSPFFIPIETNERNEELSCFSTSFFLQANCNC